MSSKKKKLEQPELIPVPLPWDDPEFAETWADWELFRRVEKKAPIGPSTRKIHCRTLKAMGRERAIQSMIQSMNRGWTGLFEPKDNGCHAPAPESDAAEALPPPPCPDWAARAERLRGRAFKLSWWTHARTDVNLQRDLLEDLIRNP